VGKVEKAESETDKPSSMLRIARAFRNLSRRNLSPFLLASMTEGSNFDFLFKVCMLPAGN
jgi:hypothetical protein